MRILTKDEILAARADEERRVVALASAEADRVKAVAAGEAATAMEAEGVAARFAISPVGWLALGIVAVGVAAFFTVRHFITLAKETKNLRDLMDTTTVKFSDQAEAMKDAADGAQEFQDWLDGLADSQESLANKTRDALKAMREQAKFEHELAAEKGASKKKLAEMDIAAAQKELDFINRSKDELKKKVDQDKIDGQAAADELKGFQDQSNQKAIGEKSEKAGEIVDEIQEAMKNGVREVDVDATNRNTQGSIIYRHRDANDDDKFPVKGMPDMSLNEAKAAFARLTAESEELAKVQKALKDIANKKKKLTEKDLADFNRLTEEAADLQSDLGMKQKFLPAIADGKGKFMHSAVSSLQQIGGFASPSVFLDVHRQTLHEIKQINSKLGRVGGATGKALPSMGATKFS